MSMQASRGAHVFPDFEFICGQAGLIPRGLGIADWASWDILAVGTGVWGIPSTGSRK